MRSLHLAELSAVLIVTLAIKVAFGPSAAAVPEPDRAAPIAAFLELQGFSLEPKPTDTEPPMLVASKAGCELRITEVSPFGWHRHVLAQLARPGESAAFIFEGAIFPSQPLWRTAVDHNWRRLLSYTGLTLPRHPVLGVLASQTCELDRLPWTRLAELS